MRILGILCLAACAAWAIPALGQQAASAPASAPAQAPIPVEALAAAPVEATARVIATVTAEESSPAGPMTQSIATGDPAHSRQELWRTHLEAPGDYQPSAELQAAIQKLQSIQVRKHYELPVAKRSELAKEAAPPPAPDHVVPQPREGLIDSVTLAHLRNMPRGGVANPAALADTLYMSNQRDLAGTFYQLAMEDKSLRPDAQAWLMFQLGNCRRDDDPEAALKVYERLLAEHPDCPWAPLARFELNLLRWHQEYQPRQFLDELGAELSPAQVVLGEPAAAQPARKAN